MNIPRLALFLLGSVFFAPTILANPDTIIEVPTLSGEVVIDGVPDEDFWKQARTIELDIETQPADNAAASVKTTAYIADNGREVLLAFRAEDPDPAKIRAFLRDRDSLWNDDFIGFTIDTFNDQRRAYEFYVNPLGAQGDLIIDGATGNEDDSWDGLWESAAKINATGYTVEMRIPYSTLRFQKTNGVAQKWGVDFLRFRPRDNRYRISNNKLVRGDNCYLCGLAKLQGFASANPGRDLEVTPTFTAGYAQSRGTPNAAWQSDGAQYELGVDVKWGIGTNLTLNGTINPDFSQVESDQAQLDLNTTFALFFPEKRPFFLEGADYFSTPFNVVYTRSVEDPDYGVRATGRNGQHTYGFFAAQDSILRVLIPGSLGSRFTRPQEEDSLVMAGRYRYDINNQTSIGLISTSRSAEDYSNTVIGIDGRWQTGGHTLTAQWLTSDSENPASFNQNPPALPLPHKQQGDAYTVAYDFSSRNWGAYASHTNFDEGFRADLGFISRVGYNKSVVGGSHTWHGEDGAKITRIRVNGDWDITHGSDGQLLERELEAYFSISGPMQSFLQIGALSREQFWQGQLFDESWWSIYGEIIPTSRLSFTLYLKDGEQIDYVNAKIDISQLEPSVNINIGKGVNLKLNHVYQKLSRDGGDVFIANLTDSRLSWQFNQRQRLRLSLQYGNTIRDKFVYNIPGSAMSEERDLSAQLLYSYKINPRTALYAGYSEGQYSDDDFPDLFATNRALFMKLSYAWQPD